MLNRVVLQLALRYLTSKKSKRFPSMVAVLSFFGVFLSVGTLIVTMSIMQGFHYSLVDKIIGFGAHISIYPTSSGFGVLEDRVKSVASATDGVSNVYSVLESQGLLTKFGGSVSGSSVGVVAQGLTFEDISQKGKNFESFSCKAADFGEDNIVLTKNIAMRLRVEKGDRVTLLIPVFNTTIVGTIPRSKTFTVGCIVSVGMYQYDETFVFTNINMATKLFKIGSSVGATYIEVKLHDPNAVNGIYKSLRSKILPLGLGMSNWQTANETMMRALAVERTAMFFILSLFIAVATFTIFSNLLLMVHEKSKSIAILRSMGMQSKQVGQIFFFTGFLVSLFGTIVGMICGVLFAKNIQAIKCFLEKTFGWDLFNPAVYFLSNLPAKVCLHDVIYIGAIALLFATIASIFPAMRAAKKLPNKILRDF